jgi:hypothetical protein
MSDALERLKHRNRPVVPSRDASLSPALPPPASLDTLMSSNLDSKNPDPKSTEKLETAAPTPGAVYPLETDLQTKQSQTKQSTLRLEQGLSDRLQDLCRSQGICREVLIEALFEYAESTPEMLSIVLAQARSKQEQRQHVANLRRAKSMMERFG